jgi:hypothetical protein
MREHVAESSLTRPLDHNRALSIPGGKEDSPKLRKLVSHTDRIVSLVALALIPGTVSIWTDQTANLALSGNDLKI